MKIKLISLVIPFKFSSKKLQVWTQERDSEDELNGLNEFPGGKIEAFEIPVEAAIREIKEEVGVDLERESLQLFKIHTVEAAKLLYLYIYLYHDDSGLFPQKHWLDLGNLDDLTKIKGSLPPANIGFLLELVDAPLLESLRKL